MEVPTLVALTTFGGASALTLVLVEVLKRAWNPDPATGERFLPLLSIAIGIFVVLLGAFGLGLLGRAEIVQAIVTGIFAGVSASGTYDLIRGSANAILDKPPS